MLQSSAYRTKRWPRRSNSRSSSSSTRLLSSGESGPPCGVPSTLGLTNPFSITPAFKNARMSFSSRLSSIRLAICPISLSCETRSKKFLEVEINAPAVAFGDVLLCLSHRLMSRPSRPEPVAVIRKRQVPTPLQNLQNRLLDEAIQHRRNAKLSHSSSIRLGDFHPPHRFRFVSPVQQLFPDGWPVLFQVILDSADGHPVNARATLVGLHLPQRCLQVFSLTYFLHQSIGAGWAFGSMRRPGRFSPFPSRLSGFTRRRRGEVQFELDVLLLVVLETHGLLTAPSRSGLRPSFPARSIHGSAFRLSECLTNLADVMT